MPMSMQYQYLSIVNGWSFVNKLIYTYVQLESTRRVSVAVAVAVATACDCDGLKFDFRAVMAVTITADATRHVHDSYGSSRKVDHARVPGATFMEQGNVPPRRSEVDALVERDIAARVIGRSKDARPGEEDAAPLVGEHAILHAWRRDAAVCTRARVSHKRRVHRAPGFAE